MLYILWGESFWAKQKLEELLVKAREKNYKIFKLEEDSQIPLNSFLNRDLFGEKIFAIAEGIVESPYEGELRALAGELNLSENIIVLKERELSEDWQNFFKKAGAKMQEFKSPSSSKLLSWLKEEAKKVGASLNPTELEILIDEAGPEPYSLLMRLERLSLEKSRPFYRKKISEPNYFYFADAASSKQKERSLLLLLSYIKEGFGAEEAFWKLWWKAKTLRLMDSGKKNTGLHPYVQKKVFEDLKNFSSEELKKLSFELLDLFSTVRRGETTFEEGLEKLILKV